MAQGHLRSLGGDEAGARRSFERALELNPALFEAWNYYARHCYAHGEHARAAELFERAHRVRPTDFSPLVFVASALHAAGDEVRSRAVAQRAAVGLLRQCELEPDNVRAHYLAPSVLHQVGRVDEARAIARRALALGGDELAAHRAIAAGGRLRARVLPAFRPDRAVDPRRPGFAGYIQTLAQASRVPIRTLDDVEAVRDKINQIEQHTLSP